METQSRRFAVLDGFTLKMIMAVLMVLDHLYYYLVPSLEWGHYAARIVAPVFCYLVTEGMLYTRNRLKYLSRLYLFALVMLAGNFVLFQIYGEWVRNSILFSLAIGASVIYCADKAQESKPGLKVLWIIGIIALFFASIYFNVEGQYMIPLMAVIFYYLRDRPVVMWTVFFFAFCLNYILSWVYSGGFPSLMYLGSQFFMILAVIPISLYNGKRGLNNAFAKYFFYVFYPVHIWIIFILEQRAMRAWDLENGFLLISRALTSLFG